MRGKIICNVCTYSNSFPVWFDVEVLPMFNQSRFFRIQRQNVGTISEVVHDCRNACEGKYDMISCKTIALKFSRRTKERSLKIT
jgi:hypothetical protein